MSSQALQVGTTDKGLTLKQCLKQEMYVAKFREVLGTRAPQFIASLVQVGSDYKLAKCDPNTVIAAAMTSAALDLPIDKNLGFSHIVPYKGQASFQMGYKGFIQLAIRSGQYQFLNCCKVFKGQLQKYNELTGEVVLDADKKESDEVVGYAAYFKLVNGYEHAEYWSKAKVEEHARRYSQAYKGDYDTPWKTNFDGMALKTVIKSLLSHWGILSIEMQKAITRDQGVQKFDPNTDIDTTAVVYPDNDPKRPVSDGPGDTDDGTDLGPQNQAEAAQADAPKETAPAAEVVDKPYESIVAFMKRDDITEHQVVCLAKVKKLCNPTTEELAQMREVSLRSIAKQWPTLLPELKKQPRE